MLQANYKILLKNSFKYKHLVTENDMCILYSYNWDFTQDLKNIGVVI